MQTVHQLGELGLLARLQRFCPPDIVGDDAAVLALPAGQQLVVTTDVLVDGVHFSDRTTPPFDAGWRATAANLSDIAAMGAVALGITVGLSLPPHTPVAWVEQLYQGISACLGEFGGSLYGGDVCRSETVSVAITALGRVESGQAFYRRSAQPGQAIVATGYHGLSRAGLAVLLEPDQWQAVPEAVQQAWVSAHRRPRPRFDVLPLLRQQLTRVGPAGAAMMDSSDGLANAVMQLCQASGTGARVAAAQLPLQPELLHYAGRDRAVEWALYGGEDFELVLTLAPDQAAALVQQLGPGAAVIGQITAASEVELADSASDRRQPLSSGAAFQHF
jgi:thiamine-monophosphate kinase